MIEVGSDGGSMYIWGNRYGLLYNHTDEWIRIVLDLPPIPPKGQLSFFCHLTSPLCFPIPHSHSFSAPQQH